MATGVEEEHNDVILGLGGWRLHWVREPWQWRQQVETPSGEVLALEGEGSGWDAYDPWDDRAVHLVVPGDVQPHVDERCVTFAWTAELSGRVLAVEAEFRQVDGDSVAFIAKLTPRVDVEYPHFSYGLTVLPGGLVRPFQWAQSPSQLAFSFPDQELTFWLLSTYDHTRGVRRFDGCQSAVFEHPSPGSLRFFLRTPPGYTAKSVRRHVLPAGKSMVLRGVLRVSPGAFYDGLTGNWQHQPLEALPPRYSYREYLAPIPPMFLDPRKYVEEGAGLTTITAVDGRPDAQSFQTWTRGPGFGGGWDGENAHNLLLHEDLLGPTPNRKLHRAHARKLLDGWIANPDYLVPENVYWRQPGDMAGTYVCSRWMPDYIWSAHQGTTMHWLAETHRLAGWEDALGTAQRLAMWLVRNQAPDGSLPSLWQFHVDLDELWRPDTPLERHYTGELPARLAGMLPCDARPPVTRPPLPDPVRAREVLGCQPASCAPLVTGLLSLHAQDGNADWLAAGRRLADHLVRQLAPPLAGAARRHPRAGPAPQGGAARAARRDRSGDGRPRPRPRQRAAVRAGRRRGPGGRGRAGPRRTPARLALARSRLPRLAARPALARPRTRRRDRARAARPRRAGG